MKEYVLQYKTEAPYGNENISHYVNQQCHTDYDGWEKWSLPLGNGYMGVNVFGRTYSERLQITENSLSNPYFKAIDRHTGSSGLNNFCELSLLFKHPFNSVTGYKRSLSLNNAVAKTEYTYNGIRYTREHFTSYPDRVFVTRLECDTVGALNFSVFAKIPFICDYLHIPGDGMGKSGNVSSEREKITFCGKMEYYNIDFEGQISVISDGTQRALNGAIEVSDATEATILLAVGTNYRLESRVFLENDPKKKLAPYPAPHEYVTDTLNNAMRYSYSELLQRHLDDYRPLIEGAFVDFGGSNAGIPTNEILDEYKVSHGSNNARYLEELYFTYGRYLLIASSRPGTYPANLQGTWNRYASAPWSSGYWHNINQQMNYWPSFNTNLNELFEIYADYFSALLPFARRLANEYLKEYFPDKYDENAESNGFVIGTGAWLYTIHGIPAPGTGHSGPGTGAFTTKLFADYYDFSQDDAMLRELAYPVNREMALFLSKMLEEQPDGTLLVKYSASPEQYHNGVHYHTKGCAFDQQMVYECYSDTVRLASVLGIEDDFIRQLKRDLPRLDPVQIGASGQLKEYREEINYGDIGEYRHRHISHLVGLYPGTIVNRNTPEWLKAAAVSLTERGDISTGWSTAHKINAWARLKRGDRAFDLLKMILKKCTLPNLWDSHPPFQIDGNFGATAGIAEMLLQSHEGYLHLLPALPSEWDTGSFEGLTARGGYTVSARWKSGRIAEFSVKAKKDGELSVFVGDGYSSPAVNQGFISARISAGETLNIIL